MSNKIVKPFFFAFLFLSLPIYIFGQSKVEKQDKKYSCFCENEKAIREYFAQYENQQNFIAQRERENEKKRKSLNLPKPIIISGFGPGPVNLVKPYYPKTTKQLKISGAVLVEVFTDEKGFVVYSKILKGNAFFRQSINKAACLSKFTPILYCGKSIKARWLITYNFIAN